MHVYLRILNIVFVHIGLLACYLGHMLLCLHDICLHVILFAYCVLFRVSMFTYYFINIVFFVFLCLHIILFALGFFRVSMFTYYFAYIEISLHVFFSCFYVYILFCLHGNFFTFFCIFLSLHIILFTLKFLYMYFFRVSMFTYYLFAL